MRLFHLWTEFRIWLKWRRQPPYPRRLTLVQKAQREIAFAAKHGRQQ